MNRTCTLIIDGRSCTNVVSQRMMEKLKLLTIPFQNLTS